MKFSSKSREKPSKSNRYLEIIKLLLAAFSSVVFGVFTIIFTVQQNITANENRKQDQKQADEQSIRTTFIGGTDWKEKVDLTNTDLPDSHNDHGELLQWNSISKNVLILVNTRFPDGSFNPIDSTELIQDGEAELDCQFNTIVQRWKPGSDNSIETNSTISVSSNNGKCYFLAESLNTSSLIQLIDVHLFSVLIYSEQAGYNISTYMGCSKEYNSNKVYFQFHEVFNIFSNLNSRFASTIYNMPLMPVYLGFNTMSITLTEFYHTCLSQSNIGHRLISLCVSDECAFDNGLWLSKHLSTFINLRHLSLIDIKLRFTSYYRALYTYIGVPEGAFYEQICRLFPYIRVCHLGFRKYMYKTLDSQIILPTNEVFISVETHFCNLQSIVIRECSLVFLEHLLKYLPQLQDLSFGLSRLWLPDRCPLKDNIKNRISNINRQLVSNLRRLKITLKHYNSSVDSVDQIFDRDVWFSLTKFTLLGPVAGPTSIRNLLSMLSSHCSYTLMVTWHVQNMISLSDTSTILLDTFRQLQSRIPIEVQLSLNDHNYCIVVLTIPQIKSILYDNEFTSKNTVYAQSRYSSITPMISNNCSTDINKITINCRDIELNDKYFSYLQTIVSFHKITSLIINNPFSLCQLHLLLSKMINLRTLELMFCCDNEDIDLKMEDLTNFLNDTSLCNMLMSNGLQKLYFYTHCKIPDLICFVSLIVKQLSRLQIIEFSCENTNDIQLPEALHILINGLSKLNFLICHGSLRGGEEQYSKMCILWKNSIHPYRIEQYIPSEIIDETILFCWL
ncbi:hypothetical protein I4U23_001506 [Adineta vaga]|nr:hypothetical protein I4U23_001506 [Adineta vaga]